MTSTPEKKTFRESAVIVLVRGHGRDLEVFWVRRSEAVAVQPGFHAFLGGKVDADDVTLPLASDADDATRAACACAIREAFEEAGVLVALTGRADPAKLPAARERLLSGHASFGTIASEHGWRFDASKLMFAGRWQTPPFAAARFDALYFLARVPEGQTPLVTPGELESGEWIRPAAALDRWRSGEVTFVAPILWTLRALEEGESGLAARLAEGPKRAAGAARRVEMKWGVVLHPMKTRPLPPADHTSAYFLGDREMVLLDPGSDDPLELRALFDLAKELEADGRRVGWIVASHHHPDHVAGIEACRARFGAPVAGHPELSRHLSLDRTLADDETLALEGAEAPWTLRVLHTPGHTRDSLSLFDPRTRSLWCGDLLSGGSATVIIDPPDGDMVAYLASLDRLLTLPVETLFPAHGSPQGAAHRRIRAVIAHRLEREARVLAAVGDEARDSSDLLPFAYADVSPELWRYAERSLLAHLIKLEADALVVRDGTGWRRPRVGERATTSSGDLQ